MTGYVTGALEHECESCPKTKDKTGMKNQEDGTEVRVGEGIKSRKRKGIDLTRQPLERVGGFRGA